MLSTLFAPFREMCHLDLVLLRSVLERELAALLPVPGTVTLWSPCVDSGTTLGPSDITEDTIELFSGFCQRQTVECVRELLFIPLKMQDADAAGLIVSEIDPAMFRKMSSEYLQRLQARMNENTVRIRSIYLEPLSGLYNCRCLLESLKDSGTSGQFRFLFLVNAPVKGSNRVPGLQKNIQTAEFLQAIVSGPVFFVNAPVYGVLMNLSSQENAFEFAHRLIKRLKREGAFRVHIGFTPLDRDDEQGVDFLLDGCWQALADAEKRGPFSLCSTQSLDGTTAGLLREIDPAGKSALQKAMGGLSEFVLVLFRLEQEELALFEIEEMLRGFVDMVHLSIKVSAHEVYLLMSGQDHVGLRRAVEDLHLKMQADPDLGKVSLGVCSWPCLKFTKSDMIMNCRKALMHGTFSGPGSCTFFDHISLNVSGDYFFEEGDYRRAVQDYQAGLELKPDDINLMNSLGVAFIEMNRLKPAADCFLNVLEQEQDNFMALVNLGFARRMTGHDREALHLFERASQAAERQDVAVSAEICMQMGRLYCQFDRFGDAVDILEQCEARGVGKQEFTLYRLLGEAYMECGRSREGMQALQKALQLYPRNAESLSLLGLLYYEAGQGEEIGLRLCRKAVEADGSNGDNWYRLGKVHYLQGNIDQAFAAVRTSINLKRNNNCSAKLLLGRLYEKDRRYSLARRMYNGILKVTGLRDKIKEEVEKSLVRIKDYRPGKTVVSG